MPPVTTPPVRAMSNITVSYNANDITGACNTAQLAATVGEIETTTLASTGKETTPGQSEWKIDCGGPWSKALDDVFYVDLLTPTAKRTVVMQVGPSGNRVTYTWTTNGYISNYTVDASNPAEALTWSGTLVLSGAPGRA